MDKGKAENYSDGSDDSDDTDDDDSRDSDSNDSDKGNKACRCTGRRGLPTPITSQLRTKRAAKHYLQWSHYSPLISSIHISD